MSQYIECEKGIIQKCLWANINDGYDIINEEIKTILTKEQMEANQYVVKRNMETN